jgi:ATP/maltotriose-dependent transcriptional regulator MalT/DNA-binding SARP family transcriptional activator
MGQGIQILHSKLLVPQPFDVIKRPRFHLLSSEILKKKLTTVIAGAGYGKTTLISQISINLDIRTVWYRLDAYDTDFTTFLNYLTHGIKKHFPTFGEKTLHSIKTVQISKGEREAVLNVFLSEIEALVQEEMIIVLDDYHIIQNSQEINESMQFILEHLTDHIHLIIISRAEPRLHLSRIIATRQAFEIREGDLAFTIPEIEQFFLQLFDVFLEDESIRIMHKKTNGWVSGLILCYHAFKGKNSQEINKLLSKLKGSLRIISNYLEENVFNLLDTDVQLFLLKTSILSRLNVVFCNQFLKTSQSKDILSKLEENHLFTFPFDEERQWYYYHHLFQDFLHTKLHHEFDQQYITGLHKTAAILWEKTGQDEDAIKHYLMADQIEQACILLNKIGRKLLKEGQIKRVCSYLKKIPENYINKNPWILYTKARSLELSGKPEEAICEYKKTLILFRKYEIPKGLVLCLNTMSHIYYLKGDYPKAEKMLKVLLSQAKDSPLLYIDVLASLIFVVSHLMKMDAADKYFKEASAMLEGSTNKGLIAWLYFSQGFRYGRSGDFTKAKNIGLKGKALCKDIVDYRLIVLGSHLTSYSSYYLGRFDEGIENGKNGLELYKEKSFRDGLQAWLHIDLSLNYTGSGRLKEAINEGEESLKISQNMGYIWTQAWACHVLFYAHMAQGNLSDAKEFVISGIDLIKGLTMPIEEGLLKGDLAQLLIEKRQWQDAHGLLSDAEELLKKSKLNLCRTYLWHARCFWEQQQKEAALNKLLTALHLSSSNQYDTWICQEKKWIIPLLTEVYALGQKQNYLKKIFENIGSYAQEELIVLQKSKNTMIKKASCHIIKVLQKVPAPGLRVFCLGEFKVFRGNEEILPAEWTSKKSKLLFKYLIHMRNRGYLAKEVLMELLWPEGDPKRINHRFHVALSALRKIIEPGIIREASSSYIFREKDAYKLHIGKSIWVDVDEFKKELKFPEGNTLPENQISRLLRAASIYKGDFLEEDFYVQWCVEERDRLKEAYLDVLTNIIEYYDRKKQYDKCIEYAKKYLQKDKYSELIYQVLMKYYSLTGNNTMVIKTYDKCKKNILEGLDSPLSTDTEALYKKLLHK